MPAPPPDPSRPGQARRADATDDAALVAAVADGDAEAFAVLVERHAARVLAVCRRELGADDAEDAAQEAFARLWRRAETFDGRASLATWLHRVAINCCRDAQRARRRRPRRTEADVAELADRLDDPQALEQVRAGRGLDPALREQILALPPAQREALVLADLWDLPLAEIAAHQGVAVGTVKSRLHRAHARVADALEPSEPSSTSHE